MSWEDEDWDAEKPAQTNWDDEDQEELEEWDKEEEEKKPVVAPKKKKTLQQKIQERKEKELEKTKEPVETELERKQRLRNTELESDLENAKTLFAGLDTNDKAQKESLLERVPTNQKEFTDYLKHLNKHFEQFESSPHYQLFADGLLRQLVAPLNLDDTRKLSASLNAIINEKQKQLKDPKKKKNAKKTLAVERSEVASYGHENLDDFDDFM
ncbi:eukaryotic translation initiation factor 3 subunit J [Gorgonomyces haynaldii]|nr:eukaryotic translation initiation factor 3 subunit J [Gorgonomyces haynaldii]